jgi:hypothetical protein
VIRIGWRSIRRVGIAVERAGAFLRDRYLVADPRTLGLFRIVLGSLLCADCIRHWIEARTYYSNEGLLSNHYYLFRPASSHHFSLFLAFSSAEEVHVAFALSFICYFLFTIGYRTRLFNVLSFLWVTSMDSRLVLVENGGYIVVNLTTFWAMFLPTGERFSVDAARRALRSDSAPPAPCVSLAVFFATLNFAFVYVFNVVNKYGDLWRRGDTIHYVLHIDRMVTGIAVFLREWLPVWALRVTTWTVLLVEALIVVLVLWPRNRLVARAVAIGLCLGLHVTLGVTMRLGPFSWFMIAWSLLLLGREHWDWLEGRGARIRTLGQSAGAALDRLFAQFPAPRRRAASSPSPLARALGRGRAALRETAVVLFAICGLTQMLAENKSVPQLLKPKQPAWVRAVIQYPRLFQGWGMFAPNPISEDGTVSVEAVTVDGRRIDPFTGLAPDLDLSDARGLGLNQIHQDYFNRIRLDRNRTYREPLRRWLVRWHEETGRPEDELVAFDVWWLTDRCPPPGALTPSHHKKVCLLGWRKPGHRAEPPLSPACRVESAGD